MSNKGQMLQDPFLNTLRKEHVQVSIYLVNGIKLQGQIESFDQYVVLLKNTVTQMVYKHAISTVVPARPVVMPHHAPNTTRKPDASVLRAPLPSGAGAARVRPRCLNARRRRPRARRRARLGRTPTARFASRRSTALATSAGAIVVGTRRAAAASGPILPSSPARARSTKSWRARTRTDGRPGAVRPHAVRRAAAQPRAEARAAASSTARA